MAEGDLPPLTTPRDVRPRPDTCTPIRLALPLAPPGLLPWHVSRRTFHHRRFFRPEQLGSARCHRPLRLVWPERRIQLAPSLEHECRVSSKRAGGTIATLPTPQRHSTCRRAEVDACLAVGNGVHRSLTREACHVAMSRQLCMRGVTAVSVLAALICASGGPTEAKAPTPESTKPKGASANSAKTEGQTHPYVGMWAPRTVTSATVSRPSPLSGMG